MDDEELENLILASIKYLRELREYDVLTQVTYDHVLDELKEWLRRVELKV